MNYGVLPRLSATLAFCLLALSSTAIFLGQISSVDSGTSAAATVGWDEALLREWGMARPWLRIRAQPDPNDPKNIEIVAAEKTGLARLSALGFKPIAFYRWGPQLWSSEVRSGGGQRLPIDLSEAYRRGFAYGVAYGRVVAGFEIENEPDISFVQDNAETYMAFQKAMYLGLKQGSAKAIPAIKGGHKADSLDSTTETVDRAVSNFQSLAPSPRPWLPLGRPADRSALRVRAWWELHNLTAYRLPPTAKRSDAPLVVMAPLALPPGPYFEQLVANELLSYTDAFNYHYYGYAEDFPGVYEQFAEAVCEFSDKQKAESKKLSGASDAGESYRLPLKAYRSVKRSLPVLLTEYGYGSLGDPDRNTVEGRVRQWAWFKSVGEQIHQLRIGGPMAFYLPPYFENKSLEFGLTTRSVVSKAETENLKPEALADGSGTVGLPLGARRRSAEGTDQGPALRFQSGDLSYKPSDFGLKKADPWMEQIGRRFGENEATPALAWLYDYGKGHPYKPKDWTVYALEASPVVIDFIAGEGLIQAKRYGGYLVTQSVRDERWDPALPEALQGKEGVITNNQLPITNNPIPLKAGTGQLVLYNFSVEIISGRLILTQGRELIADPDELESERTLEPMCRVVVPITLRVPAHEFAKQGFTLQFASDERGAGSRECGASDQRSTASKVASPVSHLQTPKATVSLFSTSFYPEATWMREIVLFDFTERLSKTENIKQKTDSAANVALLESRPLATEEPKLEATTGRWRTTRGLEVTESVDGAWQFTVKQFPAEPHKSAMAELPLPDDFVFPDGGMMRMNYRLVDPPGADIKNGKYFELYFRTANGSLYQVWPRQYAMANLQAYTELKENYTMAFYGRANLPWRFKENRPVALVFFFRPGTVPATYEVKGARIVRLVAGD